jgi:Spy/CpxP family protein refolding chaperone
MTKKKLRVLAGVIAVLACAAASPALAGEGRRGFGKARKAAPLAAKERRARANRLIRSLDATDAQRALVLEKARAAAPIVAGARDEARRIVARAWVAAGEKAGTDRKSIRAGVREEMKALRERTRAQVEPLARDVAASLTAEQRAKIEAAFAKKGRTLDDAKLTRIAARLISRPMTVAYLEARAAK